MYTLDANIFTRNADPRDPGYTSCHTLLERIRSGNLLLIEPLIVQPEVASAISRTYRDALRGRIYLDILLSLPNITFIPLGPELARDAAYIAADYSLRGMDAIYVAVARQHGCTFVTLDDEPYRRAAAIVSTRKPAEALAELPHS